jgi:hypothetical protein
MTVAYDAPSKGITTQRQIIHASAREPAWQTTLPCDRIGHTRTGAWWPRPRGCRQSASAAEPEQGSVSSIRA